jgi:hypothetical protein
VTSRDSVSDAATFGGIPLLDADRDCGAAFVLDEKSARER